MRDRLLEKQGSHALFDAPTDVERWNVRFRHSSALIRKMSYSGASEGVAESSPEPADGYVMLTAERNGSIEPMFEGFELKEGDNVDIAIYEPELEDVLQRLNRKGWKVVDVGSAGLPQNNR